MQQNPKVKFNTSRNSSNTSSDTNGNEIVTENTPKTPITGINQDFMNNQAVEGGLEKLPEEIMDQPA
jgi:hypothetical protein